MKRLLFVILLIFYSSAALFLLALFYSSQSLAETNKSIDNYFYIGKMESHNKDFTLFFKPREKAILAKGKNSNYINNYPQDLYFMIMFLKRRFLWFHMIGFLKQQKNFY